TSALNVEQSPDVRREIIRTIALLPNDQTKERVLVDATRDEDAKVREAAVIALGRFDGSASVGARLLEIAQNEASYRTQAAAVLSLAQIGSPAAEGVFRSALVTPSFREYVRQAAFRALPHLNLPARERYQIAARHSERGQPTEARRG